MPYRPSQRMNSRVCRIRIDGETFGVTYRPGKINQDMLDAVRSATRQGDEQALHIMVEQVIVSWELEDDTGQPIPATADAIREHALDLPLINFILEEVMEDAKPGEGQLRPLRRAS